MRRTAPCSPAAQLRGIVICWQLLRGAIGRSGQGVDLGVAAVSAVQRYPGARRGTRSKGDEGSAGTFTYSVYPHAGSLGQSVVVRQGYDLNRPLLVYLVGARPGQAPQRQGTFRVEPAELVLDTVKPAEDGDGMILRVYQSAAKSSVARIAVALPVGRAELCDLRERRIEDLPIRNGEVSFPIAPFQIRTLRLQLK